MVSHKISKVEKSAKDKHLIDRKKRCQDYMMESSHQEKKANCNTTMELTPLHIDINGEELIGGDEDVDGKSDTE